MHKLTKINSTTKTAFCEECGQNVKIRKTGFKNGKQRYRCINVLTQSKTVSSKKCSTCKIVKPVEEFTKNKTSPDGFQYNCKQCFNSYQVIRRYNLDSDEFFSKTNCDICGAEFVGTIDKHVDHCHNTEKVRGYLCRPCNLMLGYARDNKDTLTKAIQYLDG